MIITQIPITHNTNFICNQMWIQKQGHLKNTLWIHIPLSGGHDCKMGYISYNWLIWNDHET